MRSILIFLISAALSAGVITHAVIQKKQFYPSVVYISKSNPSMAVRTQLYVKKFHHFHHFIFVLGNLFSIVNPSFNVRKVNEKGKQLIKWKFL